jgi:hypothetical protein
MLVAGENFIKTMTRENNSKANVMGLREIYSQSDVIFKLEQNTTKLLETHGNVDLDLKGSKKIEIRKNY